MIVLGMATHPALISSGDHLSSLADLTGLGEKPCWAAAMGVIRYLCHPVMVGRLR